MTKNLRIPDHLGLKLAAVFHQPDGDGPFPLVILLHGFTGYKEEVHIVTLAEELAKIGIAALRFDAPGSGESEGTQAEHYRLTNYIDDVGDVLAYAKSNLPIDPRRIALWGHSMGGFTAVASAVRYANQLVAVCACQPSNGRKKLTPDEDSLWRETNSREFKNSRFSLRLPYAFVEDRNQFNALEETPCLTVPSLFIAGIKDEIVPAKGVRAMAKLAPEPTQYLDFDAPHGYKRHAELLAKINAATVGFFQKYLKDPVNN